MIVRVLNATVPEHNVGAFNVLLRKQLDELREQPGLVYAKLARRLEPDGSEEVVLFEEWRTPADLWRWTGGRLGTPRLLPGTEELLGELRITHYEALDMTPDEEGLLVIDSAGRDSAGRDSAGRDSAERDSAERDEQDTVGHAKERSPRVG